MLNGKVAVITGGSKGIGRAIARRLTDMGAGVALIYNEDDEAMNGTLSALSEKGACAKGYKCDVSDYDVTKRTVDKALADFGNIDILVCNAGIIRDSLILSMKEEDFDAVVDVSLKGTFNLIKHVSPHMVRKRYGRIINISSVTALRGNAGQLNYTAAKSGIIGMTKTAARELAPRGITCNAVAPGFIDTDMTNGLDERAKERIISDIPLGRVGQAEEVAALVGFLASDEAAYITGEVIRIDGGYGI